MTGGCVSCGQEGGRGRFCDACGAPLPRSCPACGSAVSFEASFCGSCGHRLVAATAASVGERRQLAVLFCDVVDSTPLSQRLDIEEFGELMLGVQQLAAESIGRLGGTV